MKKLYSVLLPLLLAACTGSDNRTITIENISDKESVDEPFVVSASQLKPQAGKLPALVNSAGEMFAAQADDLDGDGVWDELAFVYTLAPGQREVFSVRWLAPEEYPAFVPRTNARHGKMTSPGVVEILTQDSHDKYDLPRDPDNYPYQTDGPAWENDRMAFRHYFDGRNMRDVFGKTTHLMVMDSVGIRDNGYPGDTYHVMAWWGRDILSCANALGLGGIAALVDGRTLRMGVTVDKTTDNIRETSYKLISNGPVRSIFTLEFKGWDVDGTPVDVYETITIWAGKYGYENTIRVSGLPAGAELITGIVNNFNDAPYHEATVGNYKIMATHDRQTYDKVWYLGMGLMIDSDNFVREFESPRTGTEVTTSWNAVLKPSAEGLYRYNCYAAWELTDGIFTDREAFFDLLAGYADEYTSKRSKLIIN